MPDGALEFLLENTDLLGDVLLYHMTPGSAYSGDLVDGQEIPSLVYGTELMIKKQNGTASVNDAAIIVPDVNATNGVIHVIDAVLIPPGIFFPSPIPTPLPIPTGSPSAGPTKEPEFTYLVSQISQSTDWCLTATRSRPNSNVGFRVCDYHNAPKNQQWKYKNGKFISGVAGNRCLQVGFGISTYPGVRIRLGVCEDGLPDSVKTFTYDEESGRISPVENSELCLSNQGLYPNSGDNINAYACAGSPDFAWKFGQL